VHAVTIPRFGPPSVLQVRESADPTPGPGELRISVAAAGLNFAEVAARQGLYPDAPKPPCVVGYEVAGTVDALGPGVDGPAIGTRVLALTRFGGHASSVVVDARYAFPLPDSMSFAQGAAIPVNYLTAHHMLFVIGCVRPGERVLLHMAAGGVGTAVLQLLQTVEGVTVYGTASAPKHDYLRELGCQHPIDYRSLDYAAEVRRLTNGEGVDLVLDALGGGDWKTGWNLLRPAGRLVAFGFANTVGGSSRSLLRLVSQFVRVPRFSPLGAMNDNKGMHGVNMGHLWDQIDLLRPQIERIVELFEEGIVRPVIHAEVPFSEAARAHGMLEGRQNRGKVVLIPDSA
jgi:synaptic vesicle membrane protein VAT-1